MRKIHKYISALLCVSTLSLPMVYGTGYNFGNSILSAEAISVGGIDSIDINVDADNDYFSLEDTGLLIKKDGYYSCAYKLGNQFIGLDFSGDISEARDTVEETIDWVRLSVNDVWGIEYIGSDFCIVYSEDGTNITSVLSVTALKDDTDHTVTPPSVDSVIEEETSEYVKVTFSANANGGKLMDSTLYKLGEDNDYHFYSTIDTFDGCTEADDFEYYFYENGTFQLIVRDDCSGTNTTNIEIRGIDTSVKIDDEFADFTPPELTVSMDNITGLTAGTPYYIKAYTDEVCSIVIANTTTKGVLEATGVVYANGEYTIKAIDSWNNVTTKTVLVTAFGDGSLPEDKAPSGVVNENPLVNADRDTFWEDVASGKIDTLNNDYKDSSSTLSSNGSRSELPKTGKQRNVLWVGLSLIGVSSVIFAFIMRHRKAGK